MSRELNVVYIGRKPMMSYVMAVITSFTETSISTIEITLERE